MSWISNVINIIKGAVEVKDFLFVPIAPCQACHGSQAKLEKLVGGWIVHCPDGHCRNRTAGEYRFRRQAKIAWRDQVLHAVYSIDGGNTEVWEPGQPCPEELKPCFAVEEK